MTYREEALRRLISIGINEIDARVIADNICEEYVCHVFDDFPPFNWDWDKEYQPVDKQ